MPCVRHGKKLASRPGSSSLDGHQLEKIIIVWNSITIKFNKLFHSVHVLCAKRNLCAQPTADFDALAVSRSLTHSARCLLTKRPINLSNRAQLKAENLWKISHLCVFASRSWKCAWSFAFMRQKFSLNHGFGKFLDSSRTTHATLQRTRRARETGKWFLSNNNSRTIFAISLDERCDIAKVQLVSGFPRADYFCGDMRLHISNESRKI